VRGRGECEAAVGGGAGAVLHARLHGIVLLLHAPHGVMRRCVDQLHGGQAHRRIRVELRRQLPEQLQLGAVLPHAQRYGQHLAAVVVVFMVARLGWQEWWCEERPVKVLHALAMHD